MEMYGNVCRFAYEDAIDDCGDITESEHQGSVDLCMRTLQVIDLR